MPDRRIYDLIYRERLGEQWFECPICGRLTDDEVREHGPAHVVEDAST